MSFSLYRSAYFQIMNSDLKIKQFARYQRETCVFVFAGWKKNVEESSLVFNVVGIEFIQHLWLFGFIFPCSYHLRFTFFVSIDRFCCHAILYLFNGNASDKFYLQNSFESFFFVCACECIPLKKMICRNVAMRLVLSIIKPSE